MRGHTRPSYDKAWKSLAIGIIEQAMEDVRGLRKAGMIVGTQPRRKWPKGYVYDHSYRGRGNVEELLHWFNSPTGLQSLLDDMPTVHVSARTIATRVGAWRGK